MPLHVDRTRSLYFNYLTPEYARQSILNGRLLGLILEDAARQLADRASEETGFRIGLVEVRIYPAKDPE